MAVLGVNLGATVLGKQLKDGGACVVADGQPTIAIAEERLSRVKHDGGFSRSVEYSLKGAGLELQNIELCVATSCCEPVRDGHSLPAQLSRSAFPVIAAGHHEAHAYSAFWPSPFDEALIVVIDGGGNTLGRDVSPDWWTYPREQASYYVGQGDSVELIGRDFDRPFEAGFGEIFRAFTHHLGWNSASFAGNTMALAALAKSSSSARPIWRSVKGRLAAPAQMLNPGTPSRLVNDLLRNTRQRSIAPRLKGEAIRQQHASLAAWLQQSFYEALRYRVEVLVQRTGIRRACFAGGVALNCVALGRLLEDGVVDELFVQPASGDTGQCLGAALIAHKCLGGSREGPKDFDPFLGRLYSDDEIMETMKCMEIANPRLVFSDRSPDVVVQAARLIARGRILAWFSGKSEFGPRALGARSILGDARDQHTRKRLLSIKGREFFLPFAPSVLEPEQNRYFAPGGSEYMTTAVQVLESVHSKIPAVVHADGTARVQVVSHSVDSSLGRVLRAFADQTGEGLLLNTSMNLRGQAIAESPRDAMEIFLSSEIDGLFLDGYLIMKE